MPISTSEPNRTFGADSAGSPATHEVHLLARPFSSSGGYGWEYALPDELAAMSDEPGATRRSIVILLENGAPIGKAHALHDDIRQSGNGLYSHWRKTLYFSTSDNSDPNTNGRTYSLAMPGAKPVAVAPTPRAQVPPPPPPAPLLGIVDEASSELIKALADVLSRRGVKQLLYFHADHFEPWSSRTDEQRWRGLERFMNETRRYSFASRQSLFYAPWLVHALAGPGSEKDYRDDDDPVVFRRRSPTFLRNCQERIRPLEAEVGHEFHIHIHHEGWSRTNVNYGPVSAFVNAGAANASDSRRLGFYAGLCREVMTEEIGRPFDRWAFVHGNWSLNASDPRACCIEDEIKILMENGCYGDFTFPAGAAKCDPKILDVPYTCRPVVGQRSYDTAEADPRPLERGEGVLTQDRFFIWNSKIKATHSSLDFYNERNAQLLKARDPLVRAWLEQSVVFDDRLYMKTHAHSMYASYRPWEDDAFFPHTHPHTVACFELLQRVCDAAGVAFVPATVEEVMVHLRGFDSTGPETAPRRPSAPAPVAPPSVQEAVEAAPAKLPLPEEPAGSPLALVKAALLSGMRELAKDPIDSYYADRVARSAVLETYEVAIIDHLLAHCPPEQTRLFEIGIGWGMLSSCLAALGYEVTGFVGQRDHAEAARTLAAAAENAAPSLAQRLTIVEGLFPDRLNDDMLADNRQNVMIVTNLVHSFSAANQQRILEAGLDFDGLLLDVGTFGVRREHDERELLKRRLEQLFDISQTIWQGRITVMKPKASDRKSKNAAPASAPIAQEATVSFALRRPFISHGRHGWIAQLPIEFERDADRTGSPRQSPWQLIEDGQPLEPGHAVHTEIAETGGGRYSHWTTQLYFSTSDNSDPNTNGRQYDVRCAAAAVHPELAALIRQQVPQAPAVQASASANPLVKGCQGLVAIFGASFSGSTLINSVLGAHPAIFGGGEMHWLVKNPKDTVCAICRGDCRFWTPQVRADSRIDDLYHQASRLFGRPYVVDISKMREWYEEILPHFPGLPVIRVLLVKHPVRHVSSFIEKKETAGNLPDGTPAYGTPERALQRLRAFYEGFLLPGEEDVEVKYNLVEHPTRVDFVIRYEDFVSSPSKALGPLLERLGLSYVPQMEAWAQAEHHHIGGNIGPRVQINNDVPALASAARKYQQRGIFLDNSFSDILNLETIETVLIDPDSTWMRERFGYPIAEAARRLHSAAAQAAPPGEQIALNPPFTHARGHSWVAPLPDALALDADDSANKYRSPWRLLENGRPIGAPHALHEDIRDVGRGRHSHWKTQLLFSTGDNSNPNDNGRTYALVRGGIASRLPPTQPPVPVPGAKHQAAPAAPPPVSAASMPSRSGYDPAASRLADILKRRGVREVAYFHTDHFEPWGGTFSHGIRLLERFAELTRRGGFGGKLNLFYTPPVGYTLQPGVAEGPNQRRVPADGIVFHLLPQSEADRHRDAIGALVALGHEFHLHIHHTRWTRNSGNSDGKLKEWLDKNSSAEADSRRLDLFTQLACESIAYSTGRAFDRWAFIHGLWALNASDTSACMVDDEMALLMRHGCFGDFTFPAGRRHCDPQSIEMPYTCLPAVGPKAYDRTFADPRPLVKGGAHLRRDRFFIWNSPIKAPYCSLDYYHEPNRKLFKQPERLVMEWLEKSVLLDGTLFIKTHAHSLEPRYRIGEEDGANPHRHPDVASLFGLLERTCDTADVALETLTIGTLMERLCRLDDSSARHGLLREGQGF